MRLINEETAPPLRGLDARPTYVVGDFVVRRGTQDPVLRFWHIDPAWIPYRATPGSSGLDVRAWLAQPEVDGRWKPYTLVVAPGSSFRVPTGLHAAVPVGFELQCRPRSGLADRGLIIKNSPGTIDADYRGEIQVLVHNVGTDAINVSHGDRVAQLVLCPVVIADPVAVDSLAELGDTDRGSGGFGSTGVK